MPADDTLEDFLTHRLYRAGPVPAASLAAGPPADASAAVRVPAAPMPRRPLPNPRPPRRSLRTVRPADVRLPGPTPVRADGI
jgi:hypothetical protein